MRQFIASCLPDGTGQMPVTGDDYSHLCRVLRLDSGSPLEVRLPDSRLVRMRVRRVDRAERRALLEIAPDAGPAEGVAAAEVAEGFWTGTTFVLVQFLPRPPVFETILRQAAETGISTVIPVRGEYSQGPIWGDFARRMPRCRKILREARQQSGSPVDTELLPAMDAREAAAWWLAHRGRTMQDSCAAVMLREFGAGAVPLKQALSVAGSGKIPLTVAIAVGCEGGMSAAEQRCLAESGFAAVHFPVNVLRCDTAALYGIAAVQSMIMH
ncbi:MAG: RNA methyltransferase [Spirochaetaceae bacterium]|jgi:16S rRNA (uracil1498-N3)-methyltransferase|nr:RNA methyltransferase [Spirochaetaceae bacterium]